MVLANCPTSAPNPSNAVVDPTAFYNALWNAAEFQMFALEVMESGADFRFIDFNPAYIKSSPTPVALLKHQKLTDTFPPDIAAVYLQHCQNCVQTKQPTSFETSLPTNGEPTDEKNTDEKNTDEKSTDRNLTHWKLTIYPLISAGEVYQLIVVTTDVTAYKQNLKLTKSKQILQQVIDTVPAVILWKDVNSTYLGANRNFLQMSGIKSIEDVYGLTDYEMPWKKEESDFFIECDRRVMDQDKAELNIIEPQLQANGRQAWLDTSKIPLHDEQGKVVGIVAIIEDITEEKEAKDEQKRLLTILSATPDVVGIADAEGNNQYLNKAGQQLLGIPADQIDKFHISEVTHPDVTDYVLQVAMPTAIAEGSWCGESQILTRKGETIPISQVIICHRNDTGEIEHFSSVMRDISERKAIETALKQQSKELTQALNQLRNTQAQIIQAEKMSSLGQMVAGVAHEINNPVNFIHGNIQPASNYIQELLALIDLYQETYPDASTDIEDVLESLDLDFVREDLPKLLSSMSMGTTRIREIVLSLRNFSRLDESEIKTVDLHEGINSTLVILNHRLKTDNDYQTIKVVKEYGDLPLVDCYPSQLNQVLMNIFANAIDALESEPNPTITVTTTHTDDTVIICIRDNGPGIPKDIQPQILNPFFTTKEVGKGTGMGMSISYQIITEKHGGQLTFVSEEGQGTEFYITIPVRSKQSSVTS